MAAGWIRIRFDCDDRDAERLSEVLERHGAIAVTITDAADRPIHEPAPGTTPLWPSVTVTGLFDEHREPSSLERAVAASVGEREVTLDRMDERDWLSESRRDVEPIVLGSLWLGPTWLDPPDGLEVVRLDPGLAFGTGRHPTTVLCLQRLVTLELAGRRVIDFGCGSGILSLVAAARGAARVLAIDNDPQAVRSTAANAELNGFQGVIEPLREVGDRPGPADVLVANILADPLIALAPEFGRLLRTGGELSLSGIIDESNQFERVRRAFAADFSFGPDTRLDGWVRLDARRR